MGNRVKKCITLFLALVLFIVCAGLIFDRNKTATTDSANVVSEHVLVPGGNSVGIQMEVKGALVVGTTKASEAQIGDMITSVNNVKITCPKDVENIVSSSDQSVRVKAVRNGRTVEYPVTPYYDEKNGKYRLGLWIKEKIAGIGTLSFYDPETNKFAALGHGIYEPETGALLDVKEGFLLKTEVNDIKIGREGVPGEIGGTICNFEHPLGEFDKNTEYGIYCKADTSQDFDIGEPMVMGQPSQVEKGEAYIITTIDKTKKEKFQIEITGIRHQNSPSTKSFEFKVTDKRLLKRCGGIVQGMSGSPIIQNSRLIGAVTHVFVNDPTRGYGIYAKWMLEECQ